MTSARHGYRRVTAGQTKPIRFGPVRYNGERVDLTNATVQLNAIRGGSALGIDVYPFSLYDITARDELELEEESCTVYKKYWIEWTPGASDLDTPGDFIVQFKITESGGAVWYWPERMDEAGLFVNPNLD